MVGKQVKILGTVGLLLAGFLTYKIITSDRPKKVKVLPTLADGSKPVLTTGEVQSITESVFKLMSGFDVFSTSAKRTNALLENLNGADLQRIYKQFAFRSYIFSGIDETGILGDMLDLFGWFRAEYTTKELAVMQKYWNKAGLKI